MLKIHNTLTRNKDEFRPLDPPQVTFYNCGPTVYDHFHIGNARNFVLADLVRRYLRFKGYHVKFVQNVTDIDDKIIRRAADEGCSTEEIVEKYTGAYFDHIAALGIEPADLNPRATEHIPQIVAFIEKLIAKGYAYPAGGDVFFRVGRFPDYGKLSQKRIEDLQEGVRVEVDPRKEDPKDFDLWKAAKPGEPTWDSPWGPGRPGWHIECSVMANVHLGDTIDIHCGGSDLVFPHHENEIAQAEAATGKPFVRYWIHNAFLNIEGEKMSKSLGNIVSIDQVLERHEPMVVRYFFLSAHYRRPMDYGPDSLAEAGRALGRLLDGLETIDKVLALTSPPNEADDVPISGEDRQALDRTYRRFCEYMDDDFNTPRALSVLFDAVSELHEKRRGFENPATGPQARAYARVALKTMRELAGVLGLDLSGKGTTKLPTDRLVAWPARAHEELKSLGADDLAESLALQLENARLAMQATVTSVAPGATDLPAIMDEVTNAMAPPGSPLRTAMTAMGEKIRVHAPSDDELRPATAAMEALSQSLSQKASKQEAAKAAMEKMAKGPAPSPAELRAAMAKFLQAARRQKAAEDPAQKKVGDAFAVASVEAAIQIRNQARATERFEAADRVRDSLREMGIALEDYRAGTIWKKE